MRARFRNKIVRLRTILFLHAIDLRLMLILISLPVEHKSKPEEEVHLLVYQKLTLQVVL